MLQTVPGAVSVAGEEFCLGARGEIELGQLPYVAGSVAGALLVHLWGAFGEAG